MNAPTKNFYNTPRQLYPNVELCFVSYGSMDGTNEWLDSLQDENVKYFYSEESKTFSDTFNKAASLATKDYVMFLHNDIVITHGNGPQVGIIKIVYNYRASYICGT